MCLSYLSLLIHVRQKTCRRPQRIHPAQCRWICFSFLARTQSLRYRKAPPSVEASIDRWKSSNLWQCTLNRWLGLISGWSVLNWRGRRDCLWPSECFLWTNLEVTRVKVLWRTPRCDLALVGWQFDAFLVTCLLLLAPCTCSSWL